MFEKAKGLEAIAAGKKNHEAVKVVANVKTLITDSFRQKKVWGQRHCLKQLSCKSKFTKKPHLR